MNPWTSIWLHPRATIRQIVATDPEHHVVALAAAYGVFTELIGDAYNKAGDELGLLPILMFAAIAGPIIGVIGLYLGAWLLRLTGRLLGGVATTSELRAATAWGSAPLVICGAGMLVAIAVGGRDIFSHAMPWLSHHPTLAAIATGGLIVQGVGYFWTMVTYLACVAEVQRFSMLKAFGSVMLVAIPLVAAALVVLFVVTVVTAK